MIFYFGNLDLKNCILLFNLGNMEIEFLQMGRVPGDGMGVGGKGKRHKKDDDVLCICTNFPQ